jgi:predicted permease
MSSGSPDAPVFSATLDWRVLFFTIAATLFASLFFSLAPAMQFRNPRLTDALKQQTGTGSGSGLRLRRTWVALQIGLSLVLIVGAGLFVRTIQNLRNVNPGYPTDHLLEFVLAPELAGYPPGQIAPVEQRILDAIAGLPGVRGVGATNDADLSGGGRGGDVTVSGYTPKPDEEFDVELPWVSNGYLQTFEIPLLAGRYFSASDTATSQKVAIVNASFARHFFGSPGAGLGHHVSRPDRPKTDSVIVGVVADVKHTTVRDPALPTSYTLFAQEEKPDALTYYVRTWQSPDETANSIRSAVANIDSRLIVSDVSTLRQQIDESILDERTIAMLATAFGILATLLAGIGIYGILAYSTAQRTREIGIRMAFGAQRWKVIGLIVREVMILAGVTVAATIPLSILAGHSVRSQLFGVSAADPAIYYLAIFIICIVAALAGFIPARRAATIDPARALRTE